MQLAARPWLVFLVDGWANRCAISALPFFEAADEETRSRRTALWSLAFLGVQALALASYAWTRDAASLRPAAAVAFAVGFYGWVDLTLSILRRNLSSRPPAGGDDDPDQLAPAWVLFASLAVVYANGFCALGLRYADQFAGTLDGPTAALALSAATITPLDYGLVTPKGTAPVVLALLEAISALALVVSVVVAAATRPPPIGDEDLAAYLKPRRRPTFKPAPRLVPGLVTAAIVGYGLVLGLWILGV